jgi:PASTA domain-containing protein
MAVGPWTGLRRVAFVPVDRGMFNEPPGPPPNDWPEQIWRRVFYWPDAGGVDVSLRSYIRTTSQGVADIEGEVRPMQTVGVKDVPPAFLASELEGTLRGLGFNAAALVMIGGVNAGQGDMGPEAFWARFVMAEGVGVWAMELTHTLVGFADLYSDAVPHDLKPYDNMAGANGVHATAYSKTLLGWLDQSAIVEDTLVSASFDLHALELAQPAPPGRVTAVRVDAGEKALFAEARMRIDQFDGGNQWHGGIPGEGVIVYEQVGVENPAPFEGEIDPLIALLTPVALTPAQSVTSDAGVTVTVEAALDGGYRIAVANPSAPSVVVPDLFEDSASEAIAALEAVGLVANLLPPDPHDHGHALPWVIRQSPVAGTHVALGTTVTGNLTRQQQF